MADRIISLLRQESKIPGYYLFCYHRYCQPGLDSFILELKDTNTVKSDYFLSEYPANLIYCFSDGLNMSVRNMFLARKE